MDTEGVGGQYQVGMTIPGKVGGFATIIMGNTTKHGAQMEYRRGNMEGCLLLLYVAVSAIVLALGHVFRCVQNQKILSHATTTDLISRVVVQREYIHMKRRSERGVRRGRIVTKTGVADHLRDLLLSRRVVTGLCMFWQSSCWCCLRLSFRLVVAIEYYILTWCNLETTR